MAIAKKITMMYGGIFSLSLLVVSFLIIFNAAILNQNSMKQEILKSIEDIEEYLYENGSIEEETLASLMENKYVEVVVVNFKDKKSVKSTFGPPPPFIENFKQKSNNNTKVREKVFDEDGKDYMIEGDTGKEFMIVEKRVNTENGEYMIQGYKMLADNKLYIRSFASRLIFIDILGIFCAFWIGKSISRSMLKPVENIRQTAERISIEDLNQRIDITGPEDEMRELSVTFNSMFDRLETAFKKQNQFISDASHELRTPISVIQGYANLINRWGKSDPTILQESIDSILAETDHMSTLIKKLLFLAKGDQNTMHTQKEKMSLNQVVKEIVKEIGVMELKKEIKLEEKAEVEIFADPSLIKQLLWIHTENAVKYTPENGLIRFCIYKDENYGSVSVADNGAGLSKEDVPLIFDRFYRADKSRNKEIPGTGLGLSIAKWIADVHGGKITVESEPQKGTVFTNSFKLYKERDLTGGNKL